MEAAAEEVAAEEAAAKEAARTNMATKAAVGARQGSPGRRDGRGSLAPARAVVALFSMEKSKMFTVETRRLLRLLR